MRSLPAPELARILDGSARWCYRVETRAPGAVTWTDLTATAGGDWVVGIRTDGETPDAPVTRFSVRLLRTAAEGSTAPGMSASPLNRAGALFRPLAYPGREVRVWAAALAAGETRADAVWRLWLVGEVEDVDWPTDEVVLSCSTLDGVVEAAQIEVEEERGAPDPGTPLSAELQGLLTRWLPGTTLRTLGDPAIGIGPYTPAKGSLGAQIRAHAQRIAWDVRYLWDDAAQEYRYTLYLPPRPNQVPVLTFHPHTTFEVEGQRVSREYVRNAFSLEYTDAATGERKTATRENAGSIAEFRRRWMGLSEDGESPIRSASQAEALLTYADNDLSQPLTTTRRRVPFLPWLSLHDVVQLAPDGQTYDFPGVWAVVGISHEVDATSGASTVVELRGGSPVGMYYAWFARPSGGVEEPEARLLNFREIRRDDATVTLGWERTPQVVDVLVWYTTHPVPIPSDPWPVAGPPQIQCGAADEFTLELPLREHICFVQVEPRTASGAGGPIWRLQVFGTQPDEIEDVPPIVNPPVTPPADVTLETVHGGACGTDFLRHRVTWEGEGLLYWWDAEARQWKRPPGANAAFSDPSPYEMDYAGGGWVVDAVAGVDTEIRYQVMRIGVGGANASKEVSVTQKIRRCTTGGGGGGGGGGGDGDPTVTLTSALLQRAGGACTLEDVLTWSATGFQPALHRLEYQLLSYTGQPTSGWLALTQVASGELVLDRHTGRESAKIIPTEPGEVAVRLGARVRVLRRTDSALLVLGASLQLGYVVEPCPPAGGGGGGGGGGGEELDPGRDDDDRVIP